MKTIMKTSIFLPLPELIQTRQDESGVTDQHLAHAFGSDSTSLVLMIKSGKMNLPIKHVMILAEVLSIDASVVLRLTLQNKSPALLAVIEAIYNPRTLPVVSDLSS